MGGLAQIRPFASISPAPLRENGFYRKGRGVFTRQAERVGLDRKVLPKKHSSGDRRAVRRPFLAKTSLNSVAIQSARVDFVKKVGLSTQGS